MNFAANRGKLSSMSNTLLTGGVQDGEIYRSDWL